MKKEKALAYYAPTTVILVDDDKDFLKSLKSTLNHDTTMYKTFDQPQAALDYIKQSHKPNETVAQCVSQETDPDRDHRNVNINLAPIRDAIYNPKRFEHITAIVADHDMPGMKGLELCRQLKGVPIKKILLTGVASDKEALDAFNDGIIDFFISKNSQGMLSILDATLAELCTKKLKEETAIVIDNLVFPREGYEASCLGDPAFLNVFNEIVQKNNICEYYLSEENGSYTFFDIKGNPSWLVIKDNDEMQSDFFMAEDTPEQPAQEVLDGLKDHKLIVHMFTKEEESLPAKDWQSRGLLYPAKELKGNEETYYYAYIDNPDAHTVLKDKIVSFFEYREKNN